MSWLVLYHPNSPPSLGAITVVILEDVAEDIESGRQFYESREPGIGDYFVESVHWVDDPVKAVMVVGVDVAD